MSIGKPLANYKAWQRAGDWVLMSGVIAVDATTHSVIADYRQLPDAARRELATLGYDTGQLSVDVFEAPIVAQSWFVLDRIRAMAQEAGCNLASADCTLRLVQYFCDLRHYPAYNRVRTLFFPQGVVSTVVEISRLLPSDAVLVEVEATLWFGGQQRPEA